MNARLLSALLRKIPSSPVSSSIRQLRKLCVVRPGRIVLGYPRSAHGGDTMNISMCVSFVHPIARNAIRNHPRAQATDAATNWTEHHHSPISTQRVLRPYSSNPTWFDWCKYCAT